MGEAAYGPDVARLRDLPTEHATALLFATLPGVTYREVAARLGEDPALVRRRLTEGLRALRASPHEVAGQPLPQLDGEVERLDVDALVLAVEARPELGRRHLA